MGEILQALVAGAVVGALARLALPGNQNISIWITILLGAVGAIVGDLIYGALGGEETSGIDWIRWIVRVGVGALAVYVYTAFASRRSTS